MHLSEQGPWPHETIQGEEVTQPVKTLTDRMSGIFSATGIKPSCIHCRSKNTSASLNACLKLPRLTSSVGVTKLLWRAMCGGVS
jgi:hypothetical protein